MLNYAVIPVLFIVSFLTGVPNGYGQSITYRTDHLNESRQLFINYIVTSLTPHASKNFTLKNGTLKIDCPDCSPNLLQAFESMGSDDGQLDFQRLNETWLAHFLETRHNRGNDQIMVDRLVDFQAHSQFKSWVTETVNSRVKRTKRRIYRGKINGRRTSVAETLDASGQVRETEIVIERIQEPGNFEFYTYDMGGTMVTESEFPAGTRPSPVVCVGCHMTRTGLADRFIQN